MKRLTLTLALLLFLVFTTSVAAKNYQISKDHPKYDKIEANLINGLKNGNEGVQFSCVYMLGEIKSEKAVDLLAEYLRNNDDEAFRIMAALSMAKIGTERSLYMVRRVGEFTDANRLSSLCDRFYRAKTVPFTKEDEVLVTQLFNR